MNKKRRKRKEEGSANLLCNDSMNAFADGDDVYDLQVAEIGFGGDVFLQPGAERAAELIANDGERQCNGDEQESPQSVLCSSKRQPGKGAGKKRCCRQVGAAAGMNRQIAFARIQSRMCFCDRFPNLLGGQVTEQEKAGWVGMSGHAFAGIFVREQMNGRMFKRVVAPCFENEGEVEDHDLIIS